MAEREPQIAKGLDGLGLNESQPEPELQKVQSGQQDYFPGGRVSSGAS